MIRAMIKDAERYYILGDGIRKAVEFLRNNDLRSFPVGRHDVDGDRVFVLIQEPTTQPIDVAPFENHLRHADLQVTLKGTEYVGYCPVEKLTKSGEYNALTDVQLFSGTNDVLMHCATGKSFSLFFPEDGHQPYVTMGESEKIKKAVFRIRMDMIAGYSNLAL